MKLATKEIYIVKTTKGLFLKTQPFSEKYFSDFCPITLGEQYQLYNAKKLIMAEPISDRAYQLLNNKVIRLSKNQIHVKLLGKLSGISEGSSLDLDLNALIEDLYHPYHGFIEKIICKKISDLNQKQLYLAKVVALEKAYGYGLSKNKQEAIQRAIFESVERYVFGHWNSKIVSNHSSYHVLNKAGSLTKASQQDISTALATTNGWASYFDLYSAMKNSYREAVERDAVLRTVLLQKEVNEVVSDIYTKEAIRFFHFSTSHPFYVIGCQVKIKDQVFWGYGCHENMKEAIEKAYGEVSSIQINLKFQNFDKMLLSHPIMKHMGAYLDSSRTDLYLPKVARKMNVLSFEPLEGANVELQEQDFYVWEITVGKQRLYVTCIEKSKFQDLYFFEDKCFIRSDLLGATEEKIKFTVHPLA